MKYIIVIFCIIFLAACSTMNNIDNAKKGVIKYKTTFYPANGAPSRVFVSSDQPYHYSGSDVLHANSFTLNGSWMIEVIKD